MENERINAVVLLGGYLSQKKAGHNDLRLVNCEPIRCYEKACIQEGEVEIVTRRDRIGNCLVPTEKFMDAYLVRGPRK